MITCVLMVVVASTVAQPQPKTDEERPTSVIILPDGKKLPVFWEERQEQTSADYVRVQIDAPWEPTPQYWQGKVSSITVSGKERAAARERRLADGWKAAGFDLVNGRYIPKTEVELAQRARQMAGVAETSSTAPPSPSASSDNVSQATAPASVKDSVAPGFLAQWGAHIGLVIVAGLILALLARTLVFTG
jgi:hypothetical protein